MDVLPTVIAVLGGLTGLSGFIIDGAGLQSRMSARAIGPRGRTSSCSVQDEELVRDEFYR